MSSKDVYAVDDQPALVYPLLEKENQQNVEKKPNEELFEGKPFVEPPDRFKILYLIFLLHGMALLLPWNIFMNAVNYYTDYKFGAPELADKFYKKNFLFLISMFGQISNVIMNAVNMFVRTGNPKARMPYAIMLCAMVLTATVVLAIIDTSSWPYEFFIVTIVLIVITNIATGVYNTCVFYIASMFPGQYINAIIFGNNISGIFATLMNILSKATSPNLRIAAIYYFCTGIVLVLTCFILYFVTPRLAFYRYHVEKHRRQAEQEAKLAGQRFEKESIFRQYIVIIKTNWILLFSIWLCMFSTLAIFPVYQLKIQIVSSNFIVPENWYADILCFLTFNVFVTIGNLSTEFLPKWPGPKWIAVPVILKAVLSILFVLFCNYESTKRNLIPVLIKSDWGYWIGGIIYPLVSGYLISLLMMYGPQQVEGKYAGTASMLSALVLVIGVVTGLNFSIVLEKLALI